MGNGMMVGPHADPAGVLAEIVDPVRCNTPECFDLEVVDTDVFGLALRPPFPTAILDIANEFFLFRVD